MKPIKTWLVFVLLCLWSIVLSAQELIVSYAFDSQADYNNAWGTTTGSWAWSADGTAALADPLYWDGREAIRSTSGPGAAVISAGAGQLLSGTISLSGVDSLYLRFRQYYRRLNGLTRVQVLDLGSGAVYDFPINQGVLQHVETGPRDLVVLSLQQLLDDGAQFIQLSFTYDGSGYFWLIDDVELFDGKPIEDTQPAHYGPLFDSLGYAYRVDDAGWPYVPNEIVVQFAADADPQFKIDLRDTLGAILIDSCVCNTLELWQLGDDVITDQNGNPIAQGNTIDILERAKGASSRSKVDSDVNYYTAAQLQEAGLNPSLPLTQADTASLVDASPDNIRIGVIDTGVDFKHPSIAPYIKRKPSNCYANDPIGRNFVHDNNNPSDDHSHGTHVAGIMIQYLDTASVNCDFQIIPYKSHDAQGVSNLFDVACATYQALQDDVQVINDSWGFYGDSSIILRNAIDSAELQQVLVISAAGNDSLQLDSQLQYPACYSAPNRITVGSVEPDGELMLNTHSVFSNFSDLWVDILAPGRDINSTVPGNSSGLKTGTSMSAPAVSASAAISYCTQSGVFDYADVKSKVLDCAQTDGTLGTFAVNGRILNVHIPCLTPLDDEPELSLGAFTVYPNPVQDRLQIVPDFTGEQVSVRLFSLDGRLVRHMQKEVWPAMSVEELDVSALPAGMYILHVQQGSTQWTTKVVK